MSHWLVMLDVHFVILGAALDALGAGAYLRDTLRGVTQPNRVSWLLWAISPMLGFAFELQAGVGLQSLMTFVVGFFPLLIFIASFVNPLAAWKIRRLDYLCGGLAIIGLIIWIVSRHGSLALLAFVAADALAGVPTIRKSISQPTTETLSTYVFGAINALLTLLTIKKATAAQLAFPLWIFLITSFNATVIALRIGPRLQKRNRLPLASDRSH